MRPVCLSRKNSLFAGSSEGAENWACLASLIEICKWHCHVCGRPRERKQNLSECMASQVGSDVCPASDATEQSRVRMGVRRSGPNR